MDDRLLRFYNLELFHLRHMAAEFAKEFPKIAGRLLLPSDATSQCDDPWVERLLEGFAFLAARVHVKLDAEFPRFTQSLLETVYPHYLAPTPSMAVVQFQPDLSEDGLADGFPVPRGSVLRGRGDQTKCEYRTAHDVTLWPLRVVEASYHTRDLASFDIPGSWGVRAGIRIRLEATAGLNFDQVKVASLALHLQGADETPMRIYEQCFAHGMGFVVQSVTRPVRWQTYLPPANLRRMGFRDEEALLPYDARSFQGYRLLREYFALPERFMFIELAGLAPALSQVRAKQLDVLLLMQQEDLELENRVEAQGFAPFCTPAINLFPKRADPVPLSDRFAENHVVPDRTRPDHFEVYRVTRCTGLGAQAGEEQEFRPFYSARDFDAETGGGGAYFVVHRVPRTLSAKEQQRGRRSSYAGSEVYVTLVDAKAAPYSSDLRQLSIETLCTNRDLPILMPVGVGDSDFTMDLASAAPVEAIRCVSGRPRPPGASYAEGDFAWRAISHLALNYLSLAASPPTPSPRAERGPGGEDREGAAGLRDILKLYAGHAEDHVRKQIDAIKSISSKPITRPVPTPGPIAFARGLELTLTFDETGFAGTGVFLLGAVLAEFFTKYVSINSFTETLVRTLQRGVIMRWVPKIGQRHIL
jgi:type VI secretion system protein ImpG